MCFCTGQVVFRVRLNANKVDENLDMLTRTMCNGEELMLSMCGAKNKLQPGADYKQKQAQNDIVCRNKRRNTIFIH